MSDKPADNLNKENVGGGNDGNNKNKNNDNNNKNNNEPNVTSSSSSSTVANVPTTRLVPELQPKHPLQNTWDLWYYKNVSKVFEENLFNITSVDTVEDFWGLFNHVECASKLNINCAYYFFKKDIRPMWEDPVNKSGGRWLMNVSKKMNVIGQYWLELLLCLIGEGFDDCNDIVCGAFVVIKKTQDRIGIWTKEARNREANMTIGNIMKQRTQFNGEISFEPHDSKLTNNFGLKI